MTSNKDKPIDAESRDPQQQQLPEAHKTVIGRQAPPESTMNGSRVPVAVDGTTGGVVPKDDTPWILEKKEGPKKDH